MSDRNPEKHQAGVLNIVTASGGITNIEQVNVYYKSSPHGTEVTKIQRQRLRQKPRPKRVHLRPAPFPEFLDRQLEIERVTTALQSRQSYVEIYGKAEVGKSALLRYLAYQSVITKFPHGMIYHSVYPQPLEDLLQTLFEYFFDLDPNTKPTNSLCRLALPNLQALIILDDVELTQRELERLRNTAPKCAFLWASSERHLWAEGLPIKLAGLPLEDALTLVERELERPLKPSERHDAQTICAVLNGHPKQILLATALVQNQRISMARMAELLQTADPEEVLARKVFDSLSERERKPVVLLAALKGLPLHREHLAALIAFPNIESILGKLQGSGIIQARDAYYILSDTLSQTLQQTQDLSVLAKQILDYFVTWAEQHQYTPDRLLEAADTIRYLINWAVETSYWSEGLRLVQAVERPLALSGHWGAWEQVLQSGLRATQALGDKHAEAWSLHQFGVRAICLDNADAARNFLRKALRIREALGDQAGAAVTRRTLDCLSMSIGTPQYSVVVPQPRRPSQWPKIIALGGVFVIFAVFLTIGLILQGLFSGVVGAFFPDSTPIVVVSASTDTPTPTPTPTSTSIPTPTDTSTFAPTPTDTPTFTPTPTDTSTFTPTPTDTPTFTPTPTDTPTLTPAPVISFYAESYTINKSECTFLDWNAQNVQEVYLNNEPVDHSGQQEVCPPDTTTYTLDVIKPNGNGETSPVTITVLKPKLNVSPNPVDFGQQKVGGSGRTIVTVQNYGEGSLNISGVGLESGNFTKEFDYCNGFNIPQNGDCTIGILFMPTEVGAYNAPLVITTNADDSPHTVWLSGTGEGNPPQAVDDQATTPEGKGVNIPVTSNDSDLDGNLDQTTVDIDNDPAHGTADPDGYGGVTYRPDPGFTGDDSFTYLVCDDDGACSNIAKVYVTVKPQLKPPPVILPPLKSPPTISKAWPERTEIWHLGNCGPTRTNFYAIVTDDQGVAAVVLWYQVGNGTPQSKQMYRTSNSYGVTLDAITLNVRWETYNYEEAPLTWYVEAKDKPGNFNKTDPEEVIIRYCFQ